MTQANNAPSTDLRTLQDTVSSMDGVADEAVSQIITIARLALARLESPDGYDHFEDIAQALKAICSNADQMGDCIRSHADYVGLACLDKGRSRRLTAWQRFKGQR